MYADPITVSIGGADYALARVNNDLNASTYRYRGTSTMFELFIRNTTRIDKASAVIYDRHNVELVRTVFATADAPRRLFKSFWTWEIPQGGSVTDATEIAKGLIDWLDVSGQLDKLVNGES